MAPHMETVAVRHGGADTQTRAPPRAPKGRCVSAALSLLSATRVLPGHRSASRQGNVTQHPTAYESGRVPPNTL